MTITAHQKTYLHDVQVYPDVSNMTIKVVAHVENLTKKTIKDAFAVNVAGETKTLPVTLTPGMQTVEMITPLTCGGVGNVSLWSEFHPTLYDLTASVEGETKTVSFGMRSLKVEDGNLTINGNRIFLRGTLECCVFPLRGCPPMDEAGWEKTFFTAKEWGLNHLRFHSWCPPEAAFRVADKMGFYLQVELPNWSLKVNSDGGTVRFLNDEYHRMMIEYGNHPSLCLITCGNELQPDFKYLNDFVKEMKQTDPRHLYSTTSFTFEKGHGGKPALQQMLYSLTQYMQTPDFHPSVTLSAYDLRSLIQTDAKDAKTSATSIYEQVLKDFLLVLIDVCAESKDTDMQVNQICHKVGIADCYYFSRLFKKYTGMSPKTFRLKNK